MHKGSPPPLTQLNQQAMSIGGWSMLICTGYHAATIKA